MSGNSNSPELNYKKRQKLARFQKQMDAYSLRVSPKTAVLSTSLPNTVNLFMQTEAYPVRGYGSHIKQLKAAGFWVFRWRENETITRSNKTITVQRSYFRVQKVVMVDVHDESGVGE